MQKKKKGTKGTKVFQKYHVEVANMMGTVILSISCIFRLGRRCSHNPEKGQFAPVCPFQLLKYGGAIRHAIPYCSPKQ